ncbi:MAG: hypothetical protein HUU50_09360 [Candidatus Brocadiae bacterium]|nr:hypothetical protein [Candidatus Brocadiia bacterium]
MSDEQGKKSFVFSGETSLPEKTSLVASIWYEGQERLETRSYSIVQKGKFSFHYGPVLKPFPSGKYVWKIQKNASSEILYEKIYYQGSFAQKQKEIREEMSFWESWLNDIVAYKAFLEKHNREILPKKSPQTTEEQKQRLNEIYIRFYKLESQLKERKSEYSLPRFEDGYWKGFSLLEDLAKYRDVNVLRYINHFSISWESLPANAKKIPDIQDYRAEFQKYEAILPKQIIAIQKSLPLPANITEKELEEDIFWLNQIFKDLTIESQQAQKNFHAEQWRIAIQGIEEEIENFGLRVGDYESTLLSSLYPFLLDDLKALYENIKAIANFYKTKLPQKDAAQKAPIEANIEKLRTTIQKILDAINSKKIKEKEAREIAWKSMQKSISSLPVLHEEAQRGLKIVSLQEFLPWLEIYKAQKVRAEQDLTVGKAFFSDLYILSIRTLVWMDSRLEFHRKILEGKLSQDDQKIKIHLKKIDMQILLLLEHIQKEAVK